MNDAVRYKTPVLHQIHNHCIIHVPTEKFKGQPLRQVKDQGIITVKGQAPLQVKGQSLVEVKMLPETIAQGLTHSLVMLLMSGGMVALKSIICFPLGHP